MRLVRGVLVYAAILELKGVLKLRGFQILSLKGSHFVLYPEFDVVCKEHHLCTLIVVIDR